MELLLEESEFREGWFASRKHVGRLPELSAVDGV